MSAPRDDAPAPTGRPAPAARGGEWLTYRYRLGGEGTVEATGTMKAPSFGSAARRILARTVARGLGDTLGAGPVYLRLRAAGEEEVLLRGVRDDADAAAAWCLEVVRNGTYEFAAPATRRDPTHDEPAPP